MAARSTPRAPLGREPPCLLAARHRGLRGLGLTGDRARKSHVVLWVVALTLMTADGAILECSESSNTEVFQAARVHLGCLGVILTITLQCVPQFHLQEMSFPSTLKEVLSLAHHCSASGEKWRTLQQVSRILLTVPMVPMNYEV
ncbi:Hypothetical predicted protein [Marmota monax]|uniref:Uncharacterized protein n=1 Tax=Marmota monax TaxID=9995 RepID=A0A5E4BKB0_MARMO|nr:Hypothetical predicted protein [Marmota monax]